MVAIALICLAAVAIICGTWLRDRTLQREEARDTEVSVVATGLEALAAEHAKVVDRVRKLENAAAIVKGRR